MKKHYFSSVGIIKNLCRRKNRGEQNPLFLAKARLPIARPRDKEMGKRLTFSYKIVQALSRYNFFKYNDKKTKLMLEKLPNKITCESTSQKACGNYAARRRFADNCRVRRASSVIVAVSIGLAALGGSSLGLMQQPAHSATVSTANARDLIAQIPGEGMNSQLVAANTKFGFKLFSHISKQDANQNIFISPTSVAIALTMAYTGAAGQTQQAIARTLELDGMSLQQVNQANAALKASLTNLDKNIQLAIANSLWGKQNEPFKPEFIHKTQEFYGAQVRNIDFTAPNATEIINSWIQQNTRGKIDKIIEKEDIDSSTIAILINAIYFQGNWLMPFPKEKTEMRPFTLLNGTQKMHPMMFRGVDNVLYYKNELFQAISLPYGEGRLSMYIFLPNPNVSLKTFYENLNAENWQKWMDGFELEESGVFLGLPRFRVEYEIELKNPLRAMGMEIAFNSNADFTAMTPQGLSISKVKHKTFLDVNEEGTEAAGITSIGATRGGGPNINMIVDRAFFCAITDDETGTILFMGSIVEPK